MRYLDTSVVVAAITNERDTVVAQRALAGAADGTPLAISEWVSAELSAALSMMIRMGALSPLDRRRAEDAFDELAANALVVLAVAAADFAAARSYARGHRPGLPAGDALHLAIAARAGATIWTLDKGQARCARALRVPVRLIR